VVTGAIVRRGDRGMWEVRMDGHGQADGHVRVTGMRR
jgi:hypothetical protein